MIGQAPDSTKKWRFENFELDSQSGELRRDGIQVKVQLQPLKVLAMLVSHAGQVVSRDEICRHVWGGETFVDYEQGLNYCIRQIPSALGEEQGKTYIETLPRRGYRFLGSVEQVPFEQPRADARVMLAVLPLENLGGNQEQEYFADGFTDEVITVLGGLCPQRLG